MYKLLISFSWLLLILLFGCMNTEEYARVKKDLADVKLKTVDIDLDSLYKKIPEYSEVSKSIAKTGVAFKRNVLIDPSYAELIEHSKISGIAFGMYLADLAWVRQFERVQLCREYIVAVRTLSQNLALGAEEFNLLVPKFESNIDKRDSLLILTDSLMDHGKRWFSDVEMHTMSALFMGGFWLESLFLGTTGIECKNDNAISDLSEHFEILGHILFLFNYIDDDGIISNFKQDLNQLNKTYQKSNLKVLEQETRKIREKTVSMFM